MRGIALFCVENYFSEEERAF